MSEIKHLKTWKCSDHDQTVFKFGTNKNCEYLISEPKELLHTPLLMPFLC